MTWELVKTDIIMPLHEYGIRESISGFAEVTLSKWLLAEQMWQLIAAIKSAAELDPLADRQVCALARNKRTTEIHKKWINIQ